MSDYRTQVRDWLQANRPEGYDRSTYDELSYEERFDLRRAWQRQLHAGGYVGISWPAEYGGRGLGRTEEAIVNEELGRVDAPVIINDIAIDVAAPAILHWGSEEQKNEWLPRTFSAEDIWCQGFSEPHAGSDMAAMSTSATETPDGFLLNGTKVWCSLGAFANLCLIIARTEPGSERHRGLSAFVMEMDAPGLQVTPIVQVNGDSEFVRLDLEDVPVARENLIGPLGAGWKVAMTSLAYERGARSNAYQTDQLIRGMVERARTMEDVPAGTWDGLAGLYVRARAVRAWEQRQYRRRLAGEELGIEASIGKLSSSELAQEMSSFATDLFGPEAQAVRSDADAIDGGAWSKLSLTSRYYTIASGTSEVQRNIIGERLLGLPR